jgi:hypothetical protein
MNILIIEDDIFLAEKIADVFKSKIIVNRVRIMHSYKDFLYHTPLISSYDIIITDIKL